MRGPSWCPGSCHLNSPRGPRLEPCGPLNRGVSFDFQTWQGLIVMRLTTLARLVLLVAGCRRRLPGCASNPVTGTPDLVFQSEAGEIKKSKEVHPMLLQQFGGVYDDAAAAGST